MSVFPDESLSKVCHISMGQAPKGTSYNTTGNGYALIAGAGDFGELTPSPSKYTDAPTKLSQVGDLILCIRATIGDRNWSDKEYCLGRGVAGLRAKGGDLSQAYLWHWLEHSAPVLKAKGRGATFLQVSKNDIASLQIPLPPLPEQKRIAAILDAADALRAKRRESLAQLDALLQSTFLEMFGDPVANPKGWDLKQLADCVSVQGGFAFKSKDYCDGGVRLIKIANVHSETIRWAEVDYVPEDYLQRYRDFALKTGNLVIALTRPIIKSLDSVKIATVGSMDTPSLLNQRVARFVFSSESTIDKSYLLAFCKNQFFKNSVRRFCSESLQPNMSTKQLGSVLIAQPPLALQRRFATIVQSIERQKVRQRAHRTELDALFASLQHRAFNGEL